MSTTEEMSRAWSAGMSQDRLAWYAVQNPHGELRPGPTGPLMPKLLAVLLRAGLPLVKAGTPMRIREAHGWRLHLHRATKVIRVHMPGEEEPLLTLPGEVPARWEYLAQRVGYVVLYVADDLGLPRCGGELEQQRQLTSAAERGRLVAASIAYAAT
ncbi:MULTISPECIES: hypothetical protein [Streptomyces]|uniref:hypothetical protein n=1 Tax=Streptomyces TaxID=1883 RepID=UPI0006B04E31|nr:MULTISPECIES: hypothetical protein [Streptomyces]KOU51857.1 hypothetical protein ADK54_08725 [Streptomyces sp. WM6378]GGU40243.1 hypothetical protein GCM10010289_71290 [Streptomyces violascens]